MEKFLFLLICLFISKTYSQTPLAGMRGVVSNLPDISVIGNFYSEVSKESKNVLNVEEIELSFQGYLYPTIWSSLILSLHKHNNDYALDFEEGYVSFQKILFSGLGLELGKKRIDFGKINKLHSHHRPYFDQPEVITKFFNEDGLIGDGFDLSYVFPLNFFLRANFGVWDITNHHEENENNNHENFSIVDRTYSSKLWLSFPTTKVSELEIGLNYLLSKGPEFEQNKDEVNIFGLDLTYKYIISTYSLFKIQTEIMNLKRDMAYQTYNRLGGYFFVDYKISKYWSLGIIKDYVETPEVIDEENLDEKETFSSWSFVITRYITESTFLRTQYKYEDTTNKHKIYLQLVFGFGPHSHRLE